MAKPTPKGAVGERTARVSVQGGDGECAECERDNQVGGQEGPGLDAVGVVTAGVRDPSLSCPGKSRSDLLVLKNTLA